MSPGETQEVGPPCLEGQVSGGVKESLLIQVAALAAAGCGWVGPWPEFEQQIYEGRARYLSAAWAGEREAIVAKKPELSQRQFEALVDAFDGELGLVYGTDHLKNTLDSLYFRGLLTTVGVAAETGVDPGPSVKQIKTTRILQITTGGLMALIRRAAAVLGDSGAPRGAGE